MIVINRVEGHTRGKLSRVGWFLVILAGTVLTIGPTKAAATTALNLPAHPPNNGYNAIDAFPDLKFEQPVAILSPPGETNRLFVVERLGRIMVVTNLAAPTKSVFLDLRRSITSSFFEDGLLGMAFHPNYAENGYFYVYRTHATHSAAANYAYHDILSRYSVSRDDPNKADADSELRLFAQLDTAVHHNAGTIMFGPDGYLYLSIGDDGPVGDDSAPLFSQSIDKGLFGCIIRIDVDEKPENLEPNPHPSVYGNYRVPQDNPFAGVTSYNGKPVDPAKTRTEIYALGLRNPWRFSFHPVTGALIAGDVGGGFHEEINEIVPGGNYGWPYFEGPAKLADPPPAAMLKAPAITYRHGQTTNEGNCVIGGVFYFGNEIPQLRGKYVFGDFRRGHIWAVNYDQGTGINPQRERLTCVTELVSFGLDPRDGEILIVNTLSGQILRLIYVAPEEAPPFPQTLAETGAFDDLASLRPIPDFNPYRVNLPFWSDHAIKQRWFSIPENATMDFSADGNWTFPSGMVWMKHFEMEMEKGNPASRRRLETRFIVKNEAGAYGVTYRWDESGSNADLVPEAGMDEELTIIEGDATRKQIWHYPGRSECMSCHTSLGGLAIGFNTAQLNREFEFAHGTENQIQAWAKAGYLSNPDSIPEPDALRKFSDLKDESVPIQDRARSFMAANCQFCHQPGSLNARWDARFTVPLHNMNLLAPFSLVVPRSPAASDVVKRLTTRSITRMPPLGSTVQDTEAIELITRWIEGFPPPPWKNEDLSTTSREGSVHFGSETIQVSGAGVGITEESDSVHYGYIPTGGNLTATVRLNNQSSSQPGASAGLLIRKTAGESADSAYLSLNGLEIPMLTVKSAGSMSYIGGSGESGPTWLQLRKEAEQVSGWVSENGTEWVIIGAGTLASEGTFFVGLAAASGYEHQVNLAEFEQFSTISVELTEPLANSTPVASQPIYLKAEAKAHNAQISKVEFWSENEKIGESAFPFAITWTNALAGPHRLAARVIDTLGRVAVSPAREIIVAGPEARVRYVDPDVATQGNWIGTFGGLGHAIPGRLSQVAPPFSLIIGEATEAIWQVPANDPRVLTSADGGPSSATGWKSDSLSFHINSADGRLYKIGLYMVDWNNSGHSQRITLTDSESGNLLDTKTVFIPDGGIYVQWAVRGAVEVTIEGEGGTESVLSGIFLDEYPNLPPLCQMIGDANTGPVPALPHPVYLEANALDEDGQIDRVEFYVDGSKVGEAFNPPYRVQWTNALSGGHSVFARAIDDLGAAFDSDPIVVRPKLPIGAAALVKIDDATMGNWIGKYGAQGSLVVNHATNLPSTVDFWPTQNLNTTWAYPGLSETRALLSLDGSSRIASSFYSPVGFSFNTALRDGRPRLLSLYFLDWDRAAWRFNLRIWSDKGELLDEQEVSNFEDGRYFTWIVAGALRFEFTPIVGFAVVSGIFLDAAPEAAGEITINAPADSSSFRATEKILLHASVSGTTIPARDVQFFANGKCIGSSASAPFHIRWRPENASLYEIVARMNAVDSRFIDSRPIRLLAEATPTEAAAIFHQTDSETSGSWKGRYGSEGFSIMLDRTNLPPNLNLSLSGHTDYAWAAVTAETRALENSAFDIRGAPVWYADASFEIRAGSSDGLWHRFSLYCLDWDYGWREQQISILNPEDGAVLDTQTVGEFRDGKYLTWNIRGEVIVRVESIAGHAVVSGIFFDPLPNIEQWRLSKQAELPPERRDSMDDHADPDEDGIRNLLEYKLGLDPFAFDNAPNLVAYFKDGAVHLQVQVNPGASDVDLQFESSSAFENWAPSSRVIFDSLIPGQERDTLDFRISGALRELRFYRAQAVKR